MTEISGSIPSGANFNGLSLYRACSGFKRGPASRRWDWSPRLVDSWIGYRVLKKNDREMIYVQSLQVNEHLSLTFAH